MNSQLLNEYLAKKGFIPEDLYEHHAVFLDAGNILSVDDKSSWLYKDFLFVDPEGKETKLTPHDVILKKRYQYSLDNCESAIFIPLFKLSGEFTGFSIRKIGGSGWIHGCIIDIDYYNHFVPGCQAFGEESL